MKFKVKVFPNTEVEKSSTIKENESDDWLRRKSLKNGKVVLPIETLQLEQKCQFSKNSCHYVFQDINLK